MKTARLILLFLLAGVCAGRAQSILEQLDNALTFTAFDGSCRVRLSGLVDLETYHVEQPPPGLIYTDRRTLFNPRLTLYLDAQLGSHIYAFGEFRVDRGFDPGDRGAQARFDQYAIRYTPWDDGRINLQIGKFATVVGNWSHRYDSWESPFITAPLPYQNTTGVWHSMAPGVAYTLLEWSHANTMDSPGDVYGDKRMRVPIIWGPAYGTGASISGAVGKFDYAVELKNSSLSSPPDAWDLSEVNFSHPTISGRLGWKPNEMWNLGVSASEGTYLLPDGAPTVPPGYGLRDYREILLGQDISFAWHHFQLWAEFYETRFEVPNVGNADSFSYYVEAKYKITPQLFGAARWNQQLFGDIRDDEGNPMRWNPNAWQWDFSVGYRFTEYMQLKFQYSLLKQDPAENAYNNLFAAQFTLRF